MNNRFPATGESRFWFSLIVSGLGGRLMFCFGLRSGRLLVLDHFSMDGDEMPYSETEIIPSGIISAINTEGKKNR